MKQPITLDFISKSMKFTSLMTLVVGIFFGAYSHSGEISESDISACESKDFKQSMKYPPYPAASRRNYESGKILLEISINANGCPTKIFIRNSSGFSRLDMAATNWAKNQKFTPEDKSTIKLIPVSFSLQDSTGECVEETRKNYIEREKIDVQLAHEKAISQCTPTPPGK